MILDERTEFADSVAVTGAAGTQVVGDVLDLSDARDVGQGEPVYWVVVVETAPAGADTVKFQLVSDAVDPPAADGTETVHIATDDEAIADLPAGTTFVFALPSEGKVYEQFMALEVVTVGASSLTALVVSSFLTGDPHGWKAYADALPA